MSTNAWRLPPIATMTVERARGDDVCTCSSMLLRMRPSARVSLRISWRWRACCSCVQTKSSCFSFWSSVIFCTSRFTSYLYASRSSYEASHTHSVSVVGPPSRSAHVHGHCDARTFKILAKISRSTWNRTSSCRATSKRATRAVGMRITRHTPECQSRSNDEPTCSIFLRSCTSFSSVLLIFFLNDWRSAFAYRTFRQERASTSVRV